MSERGKERYIESVRTAMETDPEEMTRAEYIDALDEITGDIEAMLDVARQEARAESRKGKR